MNNKIEELVGCVLHELETHGLTQATIYQYKRGLYQPIIKFFNSTNSGNYSTQTFEACMKNYEDQYLSGKIKRHHYLSMKRSLEYIRDYALLGKVDFTRKVDTRKYKPSTEAIAVIECALEATDLKEGFKYSLHVCMRHFFCYIESQSMKVEDISVATIKGFLVSARNTNPGSMDYIIYSLKVLISYLNISRITNIKVDLGYFVPKSPPQKIIPAFTMEEIDKVLKCIDCSTSSGKRDNAIILLACATGLRGIDIVKLKLENINWKAGEISIFQSKTGNLINITVNGQILNAILKGASPIQRWGHYQRKKMKLSLIQKC
ncbi:tyrosine-type recombinase/integrase [Alkaliphilus hydrothermalis]|uniref:Site-specific recombinase XerD n=1 Tax=Alkaliphilus hydrothermalis TaxID=1482730 RepID=A0ABS2NRU4_9FIRM|nr:tyrosine-type recombinase/integrase [Alkaliphilus hydrothermalis]MBM7615668.1 site-specific recombinase XerD [Alkaliphilus hydrothermalis]